MPRLFIYVDGETKRRLERLAEERQVSVSEIVRDAIRRCIFDPRVRSG